jgi:hypothetical protein
LARRYGATIVPGSVVLPDPRIEGGRIRFGPGPLYNVALLFHPDGSIDPRITRKVYPTTEESRFSEPGRLEDLPVCETPAGKVGVLICADSWYPEAYRALAEKGAASVLVPSYTEKDRMGQTWKGYIPEFPTPGDVSASEAGRIALSKAWERYALAGRLPGSGIPNGILARLQGNFWGLGSDGSGTAVQGGVVHQAKAIHGSSLINLWL